MKDLYKTLGLNQKAGLQEIKLAYKKAALQAHPDRGGDAEKMASINEAYEILSDPVKRKNFDTSFNLSVDDESLNNENINFVDAGNLVPFSEKYKQEHANLVNKYKRNPLSRIDPNLFKNLQPSVYREKIRNIEREFDNIFDLIIEKSKQKNNSELNINQPLSISYAVGFLIQFLEGSYSLFQCEQICSFFNNELNNLKSTNRNSPELVLYEGIYEIINYASSRPNARKNLIYSLQKITDFAKKTTDLNLLNIIPLFYNRYFRSLFTYALEKYINDPENIFTAESLNKFDGQEETRSVLEILLNRLANSSDEDLINTTQYVRLLHRLEKDLHRNDENLAEKMRAKAFHLLDWIPAIAQRSSKKVLINFLLQIGLNFQKSSLKERISPLKMADQKLAMQIFLTAISIAHRDSTPDIEIYANSHVLKYLSSFIFDDQDLHEIIPALKKRLNTVSDFYPFYEDQNTNISFLRDENKSLHLMRRLLNVMLDIHEHNKNNSNPIDLHHSPVEILYHVYEACLQNWYQTQQGSEFENNIRLELMEELLFANNWTFLDIEQNIDTPYIMVDRDEEGWLRPSRVLPFVQNPEIQIYKSINGAQINQKTGEINFILDSWSPNDPEYQKTFTLYDIQEMLEKNISGAMFSLDPVDPDKPYHPYNVMRIAPKQINETELLNTMLMTDYILKFLTTKQEVQGRYPFNQRNIDSMISHLPVHLRRIIENFHSHQRSGSMHRFWIEAEEVDVSIQEMNDNLTIGVDSLKMVVKKHRLERDMNGNLQDASDRDEGWPIYVLNKDKFLLLRNGRLNIDEDAIILVHATNKICCYTDNQLIERTVSEDFYESLNRLFNQPKNEHGKIIQNTVNTSLIVRSIKIMTNIFGVPNNFSPEFIFAHEFTKHYDEFAQFLPEFGKLKELSKISTVIRLFDNIRAHNEEEIEAINLLTHSGIKIKSPKSDVFQQYFINQERIINNISSQFKTWSSDLSKIKLEEKWLKKLRDIRKEVGTLSFTKYSDEVNKHCQNWFREISKDNPRVSSHRIWDEVINPKKEEIAREMSKAKRKAITHQLTDLFSSLLNNINSYELGRLIENFLKDNFNPLLKLLVEKEMDQAVRQIKQNFPHSSNNDIINALNGNESAAKQIGHSEVISLFNEQKRHKENIESGFNQIGLKKEPQAENLEDKCFWVPASVRHEVGNSASNSRYSFFVYGGVNVQPRINQVRGGGIPSGNSRANSGSFNRASILRGFQDHHIVSHTNSATKNHPLLKESGFNNLNARANRIFLPTCETLHPTRSIHRGRHTTAAMKNVQRHMDDIYERGQAEDWSKDQYRTAFRAMLSEIRQELRAGNVALNSKHRPWAK